MLQNIGISEFVLIALAALVLFGPDKLPGIGRKLGQAVRQIRSGASTFIEEITRDPELRRKGQPEAPAAARTAEKAPGPVPKPVPESASADTDAAAAAGSPIADKLRRAPDPRRLPE